MRQGATPVCWNDRAALASEVGESTGHVATGHAPSYVSKNLEADGGEAARIRSIPG